MLFLLLGILISLQAQFVRPEYFPKGFSLFPTWPAQDPVLAAWVFVATMGLLIIPKFMAYVLLATQAGNRRGFGGAAVVLAGVLIETLLSGLIAPVMMIFQSTAVGEILLGRDSGWQVQRRDDGKLPGRELIRKYALPSLFGVVMAASAYAVSVPLLLWMTPVIIGLLLCVPIAVLTSMVSDGGSRLFRTPEQSAPPQVLLRANELTSISDGAVGSALAELRGDRQLLEHHLANAPGDNGRHRGKVDPDLAIARAKIEDAQNFDEVLNYLTARETFAVLNAPMLLRRLCEMSPGPAQGQLADACIQEQPFTDRDAGGREHR